MPESQPAMADDRTPVYFEDLAVGRVFRAGPYAVTAAAIKDFAQAFDPQPFHLDEARAAGTFFGELVASGWHTAAMTMRLIVDGELKLAGGIVGAGMDELRWPRPTRPGDTLRLESEVLETRGLKSRPSHGLARIRNTTLTQKDEVVQSFVATLFVPRREGS